MSHRRARAITLATIVVAVGVLVGSLVRQPTSSSAAQPLPQASAPSVTGLESTHPAPAVLPPVEEHHQLGAQDGLVPDGVTVFNDAYPAVSKLDPALLRALRRAATDAASSRVTIFVNSGWRSAAYQDELLQEAVKARDVPDTCADAARGY